MQFDFRKLNRMRSYIWKKIFVWCLIYDFVISPEFILRELSSYRAYVVIWGNLWNSIILIYSNYFCPYNDLFKFGLFMNTGWMSILAKTFWKRRLLINLAFSTLKISLISFLKGRRLPGKTKLSLPSSWKSKYIHNNNTHNYC